MRHLFTRLSMVGVLTFSALLSAQTGKVGINTDEPRATLDVQPSERNTNSTTNEGAILPQLSKSRVGKIANDKLIEGTLIYVNEIDNTIYNGKIRNMSYPGYYYYNPSRKMWFKLTSGLDQITIEGKTGWRLSGINSVYNSLYKGIGDGAVDLSFSNRKINGEVINGASGKNSVAMGFNTIASGNYSTAMGFNTTANGDHSTAMGYGATASGDHSTAMGYGTTASGDYSVAMGRYGYSSEKNLVSVGNGYSNRGENVFVIDYNGNVAIGLNEIDGNNAPKLEVKGTIKATKINFTGLPTFKDDSAAEKGRLKQGDCYKTPTGELRIKL